VAAAAVAIVACGPRVATVSRPEWQTVGELTHPRAFASAVALSSGKILVVGGLDNDDPAVMNYESELVDPVTGAVTVLPQKLLGRLHQSITRGWDDSVVVTGGVEWRKTFWSPVDRVDVFLPSEQRWVRGQSMRQARSDHAATALHDGRILVTGGNADTKLLSSVELYDPSLDRWTDGAPMPRPRTQHSATTLIDGRVLVTGGIDSDGLATDTTFMYDPRSDSWVEGPSLTTARIHQLVVALPSGNVLLAGGDGVAAGTSELFDFRTMRFIPSGTLADPRLVAQGAVLPDGRVVIAGGLPPRMREFQPLRSAEIWEPETGLWKTLPPSPTGRAWGTIISVGGVVYQLSGTGDGESAYRTIERLAFN
jgi:N-acetylneuraminic acid mutarotase